MEYDEWWHLVSVWLAEWNLSCKLVTFFSNFKRLKQLNMSARKGEESERQRQRQQPSLPIWAVFGQPSRGHMAVWVKELFWLLPYSPHLLAGMWETCYDKDSKHLSMLERRRHIAEERWIGIKWNIKRAFRAMSYWNGRYCATEVGSLLNVNIKNSKYFRGRGDIVFLHLRPGEP